jgi:DNA-binding SARP family transcriptional activator
MAGWETVEQRLEAPPAQLHVHLLGTPEVTWQGEPLDLPRRQVRALLYRLAVDTQPISRDSLCFLFWPDVGETTARHNLSRLLTLLHRTLPDPGILVAQDDRVELRRACVWCDTRSLHALSAAWHDHGAIDALRQAADLYRGPFLDGFCLPDSPEFDLWASQERAHWERLALQALFALVEALALDGDYPGAIAYAQRALAIDELAEDVQRRLIELHALAGQRSAALRQYEQCVAVLERELGVDPTPATQAVYRAVLHSDGWTLPPVGGPAWSALALPAGEAPLLGRAAELAAFDEALHQARAGHGRALLIAGEPGAGKSRLLHEFTGRARSQALALAGCCYPETQASPYQPLIEALRPHLSMHRLEFDAYPAWLSDLVQLFPELRPLHPGLAQTPACEPGWARTRLFEALESLLLRLAPGASPILLCLDNLHWADSATLDWLAYLARRMPGRPILLVGAYRPQNGAALAALRASLARQGLLRELALDGLDATSVGQLVQRQGGSLASDPALAGRLHQVTGGNPFFLLETLAALAAAGLETAPGGEAQTWPLPDSVRQAVQQRIERLSPSARQVLEAAAVIGQTTGCDTLHLTAGRAELELADALDELAAQQFVVQEPGLVRFRHELVAEVVCLGLSTYRRQLLHRRAGEALQRTRPDDAAALARHFAAAGLPGQAARNAVQAGLNAKQVFAHAEARSHFDQALALLTQEAASLRDPTVLADNRRLRIEALGQRGWALRLLGDMAAYSRDLDEEARLASALDDPAALAHLRWRQASAHLWFCRHGEARAAAEEGLRLSRAVGDDFLQAACLRALGLAARESGEYDLAQRAIELALEGFARLDQPSLRLHTLGNLSTLALYQGDPARALELARQALAVCETAGCDPDRRVPLGDIGAAALALGDGELARPTLEESLAIARQISDRTQEIFCLGHLGWLAVREGQAAAALEHLRAALALAEQVHSLAEQPSLHAGLAEALRLAGDPAGAAAHARQAVDLAEATGQAHAQGLAQQVQARVFAHEPAPAVVDW